MRLISNYQLSKSPSLYLVVEGKYPLPLLSPVCAHPLEQETQVRKDNHRQEKAATRAFFWLKVPTFTFIVKNLLRRYDKQVPIRREIGMLAQGS